MIPRQKAPPLGAISAGVSDRGGLVIQAAE
jgi:hypothetical protein